MKELSIILTGDEVRAVLDGRKTQDRRVIEPQPDHALIALETHDQRDLPDWKEVPYAYNTIGGRRWRCPYGQPGDLLRVKETWQNSPDGVVYRATEEDAGILEPDDRRVWRSSSTMPKRATRLWLRIVDVRVERLQEMSYRDWVDDFCPTFQEQEEGRRPFVGARIQSNLAEGAWDSRNAKKGHPWSGNWWVWGMTFERVER